MSFSRKRESRSGSRVTRFARRACEAGARDDSRDMTANKLRAKYLEFFQFKGHTIIPSASLIPENDPTVLFTTAGMHPLVPYLMGEKHPGGARLCNAQKCIRTSDIDEVGDATHHTFFEMLGNWSLGDYFKKEAIEWSWEFLTSPQWLNLDKNRIAVSVFAGDADAPFDEEAFSIWKGLGLPEARIARLPKKNNWWGPAGETGPCGPDTEIFYWVGDPSTGSGQALASFNDDNSLWVEIWNDVFMQYNKNVEGKYEKLAQQNVDTGMGLERTLAALNGLDDNYKTELFWPLIQKIEELSGKKYGMHITSPQPSPSKGEGEILPSPPFVKEGEDTTRAMRIVADHIKAAAFILGDDKGLTPSNVGAGYVLRRIIRRAVRYGKQLGINDIFTFKISEEVIKIYQSTYAELKKNEEFIVNQLTLEEEKFAKVLKGKNAETEIVEALKESLNWLDSETVVTIGSAPITSYKVNRDREEVYKDFGKKMFDIYQKTGYPLEVVLEEFKKQRFLSDYFIKTVTNSFQEELKKHQELSRTASAGMFKGGLADASEATVKYHTAAHLMLAALRQVLGEGITQKGSNITAERLRFDFSFDRKMTPEEISWVEKIVNEKIKEDLPVTCEEMSLNEAKAKGAMGVFESKYGERVKVYTIGDPSNRFALSGPPFSREICGGPHVERTGLLGKFKIKKEESSSAGVRRIKAVLE